MQNVPIFMSGQAGRTCGKMWFTEEVQEAILNGAYLELSAHIRHPLEGDEAPEIVGFTLTPKVDHADGEPDASNN